MNTSDPFLSLCVIVFVLVTSVALLVQYTQ